MRQKIAVMAATLAVAVAPILVATPAHADTEGCVTTAEFKAVKKGWGLPRVHNKFDTAGHLSSQSGPYVTREYRACRHPRDSYIAISYDHRRVYYKSAYFG